MTHGPPRTSLRLGLQMVVVLAAVIFGAARFVSIDASSHSASDTLRPWLVDVVPAAILALVLIFAIARYGRSDPPADR